MYECIKINCYRYLNEHKIENITEFKYFLDKINILSTVFYATLLIITSSTVVEFKFIKLLNMKK